MIIIYHNDERNSTNYAQLLSQKGFDNVYLLSGGIEDFISVFLKNVKVIKLNSI